MLVDVGAATAGGVTAAGSAHLRGDSHRNTVVQRGGPGNAELENVENLLAARAVITVAGEADGPVV